MGTNAVEAYAGLHLDFVTIRPFFDGNGRVARLIANLPVLRSGFPPIVVPTEARQEYKRSISDYQTTIPELEGLETLSDLPDNLERVASEACVVAIGNRPRHCYGRRWKCRKKEMSNDPPRQGTKRATTRVIISAGRSISLVH